MVKGERAGNSCVFPWTGWIFPREQSAGCPSAHSRVQKRIPTLLSAGFTCGWEACVDTSSLLLWPCRSRGLCHLLPVWHYPLSFLPVFQCCPSIQQSADPSRAVWRTHSCLLNTIPHASHTLAVLCFVSSVIPLGLSLHLCSGNELIF